MFEVDNPVNPFQIIDDRRNWFYRAGQYSPIYTIGPGRRTRDGIPFVELGVGVWIAISILVGSWERSESLTGPWEPVQ